LLPLTNKTGRVALKNDIHKVMLISNFSSWKIRGSPPPRNKKRRDFIRRKRTRNVLISLCVGEVRQTVSLTVDGSSRLLAHSSQNPLALTRASFLPGPLTMG
jgi:hypothetical protein